MICRLWRGWTSPENAASYEALLKGTIIPAIEGRAIHYEVSDRREQEA